MRLIVCEYAVLDIARGQRWESGANRQNNCFSGEDCERIEHRVTKGVKKEEVEIWVVKDRKEGVCGMKVEETDR